MVCFFVGGVDGILVVEEVIVFEDGVVGVDVEGDGLFDWVGVVFDG